MELLWPAEGSVIKDSEVHQMKLNILSYKGVFISFLGC